MAKLTYDKKAGVISIQILVKNIPSWSFLYNEDQSHSNNSSSNNREHTIGKPHELEMPLHDWIFTLNNTLDEEISGVELKITWYQEVKGKNMPINTWVKSDIKVKANDGKLVEDRIILNPV